MNKLTCSFLVYFIWILNIPGELENFQIIGDSKNLRTDFLAGEENMNEMSYRNVNEELGKGLFMSYRACCIL